MFDEPARPWHPGSGFRLRRRAGSTSPSATWRATSGWRSWSRRDACGAPSAHRGLRDTPAGGAHAMTLDRLRAALADRYRIERELGAGRHGHRLPRARPQARPRGRHQGAAPRTRAALGAERFLREIKTTASAAASAHPAAARLRRGRRPALLRDALVEGETLRARLDRETPAADRRRACASRAKSPTRSTTRTRHGVIHRDIKPENILLQDGQPWSPTSASRSRCSAAGGARMTRDGPLARHAAAT